MSVLIVYATVEGHTRKIAEYIGAGLERKGISNSVELASSIQVYQVPQYDAVIVCAPVHIGRYPSSIMEFVIRSKSLLLERSTAFVSSSLGICSEHSKDREEVMQLPENLFSKTGWHPDNVLHVAGALKYLEYDFFKRWMMRHIVRREGGPVDTCQDYVLTNWQSIDSFVDDFSDCIGDNSVEHDTNTLEFLT